MRGFHVKFTEKNLTGNAEMVLLGLSADKLKLPRCLSNTLLLRGATAQYKVSDIIMILMMALLEGAEKGYNPKKPGQRGYHSLLCFIAETRECLHYWFRA